MVYILFNFADVTENSVLEHSIHQEKTGHTNGIICIIKPVYEIREGILGDQRRYFNILLWGLFVNYG